jgi:two-component system phosphate regulon sensor histidine kinase PhoR
MFGKGGGGQNLDEFGLQSILFALPDALIAYNEQFVVLFFNPAAETLFNLKQEEVIGHTLRAQDAEDARWRVLTQVIFPTLAPLMVARSEPGAALQEVDISFSDPALELRVMTAPLVNETGSIGFIKIIRDRTRELFLLRSKGEFVTIASHQLRGPITDINWGIEALGNDETLNESSRSIVAHTKEAAVQLLKIMEDFLNIAKIEEGHFGYQMAQTDLIEFIKKALTTILPSARALGINLYFDEPKEPISPVFIDSAKLSMVLFNLLENAVRYNVQGGRITVKVEKQADAPFVKVSVADTGIGIPPEDINKLFSKFYRAKNALKSQTEGSGLGLYIARNIVRAHGGQIGAESELQRGSTFFFTLPLDQSMVPQHEVPIE